MSRKNTIEWATQTALTVRLRLDSEAYLGNKFKLDYTCLDCGFTFQSKPNTVQQGSGCPKCADKRKGQACRLSVQDYHDQAARFGGRYLGPDPPPGNNIKVPWECSEKHEFKATRGNVSMGWWCKLCGIEVMKSKQQLDESILHATALEKGGTFVGPYINSGIPTGWTCCKGHSFQMRWDNVKSGSWCPTCALERSRRYKNPLHKKIANKLRQRFNKAFRNKAKSGSAVRDLGMSIAEFELYIESLWEPGMNWYNYGKEEGEWSFDHTVSFGSIDVENRDQLLPVLHWSNIKPMWVPENSAKGARDNWDSKAYRARHTRPR